MKTILSLALLLLSPMAFAITSNEVTQVLQDEKVARILQNLSINKIEEIAHYRCPGCYDISIDFDDSKMTIRTSTDWTTHKIIVGTIKLQSKSN